MMLVILNSIQDLLTFRGSRIQCGMTPHESGVNYNY